MTDRSQSQTLTLSLDAERVPVDGKVSGRVKAGASANVLAVELLWRTSGKCEPEEKVTARDEVAPGAPFEFRVPAAGPMSYEGKTFSVRWFVRTRTDAGELAEKGFTVTAAQ
jgi:hypothetical protein